ncbi:MAG: hypothetical protein A2Y73_08920, partial [Chloroflexi bacterium RBG_13_56_8]
MANELSLTVTTNKDSVPVTTTQQLVYALIEVVPNPTVARMRVGLNFGFVLDRSGSMRGEKVERLRQAVSLALGRMAPDDMVSVTIFSDRAQVIAKSGTLADHRNLNKDIRGIRAGGGTQMSRGMSLGLREVYRNFDENRANRLLLLTDGQTYGDEAQCRKLAREAGEHRIPIQALGLGDDWNEDLLDEIGALSGGDSDLIESADEITTLFTETVERSQKAVVRGAQMVLRLASGVTPRQVWQVTPLITNLGYTPIGEYDVQVDLGELDAEEGRALLVELLLPPRQAGRYRIAQAEITYDLPLQNIQRASVRNDIVLQYTTNAQATQRYNAHIMNLVEQVAAYKLQTRALDEA